MRCGPYDTENTSKDAGARIKSGMTEGEKQIVPSRWLGAWRFAQDDTSGVLCRMTEGDKAGMTDKNKKTKEKTLDPRLLMSRMTEGEKARMAEGKSDY